MPHKKRSSNRFRTVGLKCKKLWGYEHHMTSSANAVIGDLAKRFVDTFAQLAVTACMKKTGRITINSRDMSCAANLMGMGLGMGRSNERKVSVAIASQVAHKLPSKKNRPRLGCLSLNTFKQALVSHGARRVSMLAIWEMGCCFQYYMRELIKKSAQAVRDPHRTITTRCVRDAMCGTEDKINKGVLTRGIDPAWEEWGKKWMIGGVTGDHSFKQTAPPPLSARHPIIIVASPKITWGMGPFAH